MFHSRMLCIHACMSCGHGCSRRKCISISFWVRNLDLRSRLTSSRAIMPPKKAAAACGRIPGDVYWTQNFICSVRRLNGEQWQRTINLMSEANRNHFFMDEMYWEVVRLMALPDDRILRLDDSRHSFNTLPRLIYSYQAMWCFIEVVKPSIAASDV